MKKQILLFVLMLLPIVAKAYDAEINGIYYNFSGDEATVTYKEPYYISYSGSVVIPESVTYNVKTYSVTAIDGNAFLNCTNLTSITISNSVTSIGEHAFAYCKSLTSITIPNSVTTIGRSAFLDCIGLTSITIGNNVTIIGDYAFAGCDGVIYITVESNNQKYDSRNNCNAIIETSSNTLCFGCKSTNIPNSVTSIGDGAFYGCSGLTSIIIPSSVTSLGYSAFYGCSGLTSITIPNSITSIRDKAFYDCIGLTSVTLESHTIVSASRSSTSSMRNIFGDQVKSYIIGDAVNSIGESAFYGCSDLTSITIPNSVTSIGESAFYRCSGLTSITIPNSVTSIGESAFYRCSGLTSITIPNSVTSIGRDAFYGCTSVENLIYAEGTRRVLQTGLTSIISVIIPNSVTSISDYAFYNCNSLTSITIPNSVTSIGNDAFYGCSGLTSIIIPSSVTSLGYSAFSGCSGLTSITIPNSITSIRDKAFYDCIGLTSITIPNSITSIGYSAFSGCCGLFSITIPNSVTSIGERAFSGCSGLTSVIIPNSVTSIGSGVFSGTNIKKVIWLTNTPPSGYSNASGAINYVSNEQYTSLQNKVVYPFLSSMFEVEGIKYVPVNPSERTCDAIDCVYDKSASNLNITSIVSYRGITMSVQKMQPYFCFNNKFIETLNCENDGDIAKYAFSGCTGITNAVCNNSGNIAEYAFSGCTNMTNLTLGENVSAIGDYAFQDCSSMQSINISDAVATLGEYAFNNCIQMTSARIGTGIKEIPSCAFSDCSGLTDIQLGQNVQSIGWGAFSGCRSLPTINIPKSVNTIGDNTFQGCTALKNFIIADRENELSLGCNFILPLFADCPLDSVYIGGNISYNVNYSPFYRNTTLRTVVITDKETEISPNEFYGCTNLQNFTVGDGVTSFGDWAFSGCTSLKSLSFGSQLQSIGKEAFSDCASVTKIVSKATTPPSCGDQALDDINKWDCTLYVPEGSLASYQGAEQWKQFFFIEEGAGSDVEPNPEVKKCAKPTISYVSGKLTFNCETEGAICQSSIKDADIKSYSGNEVQLGVTYSISVYATKIGYDDSEVATATLCWIDVEPQKEGIIDEDAVAEVKAMPVLIQTQGGTITILGATEGTPIAIYSIDGRKYGSTIAEKDSTTISTTLQSGSVAVVKIGEKSVKVLMK